MDISNNETCNNNKDLDNSSTANKLHEMPGKALDLNRKYQNCALFASDNKIGLQKRFTVSSVETHKQPVSSNLSKNNFLLSPGALTRTESTLSMSLLNKKQKESLFKGPCDQI